MKKLLLTPVLLALLLFLTNGSAPHTERLQLKNVLTLEQEPLASNASMVPEYKSTSTFVSEIFETQTFQLLSLNWEEEIPSETAANLEIRFRNLKGEWTEWQALHEDEDGETKDDGLWSYVITEDSNAFQYRALLSTSDNAVTPKLANFTFDSANGGKEAPLRQLTQLFKTTTPDIVTRYAWGADENLRLAKNFESLTTSEVDAIQTPVDPRFQYDPDLDIIKTVETNASGEYYWWPQEYPKTVKKIVIHHTATTKDLSNPAEAVRAIYQYHTLTRAWGDIGYNFIIAPNGTVYQGRAGSPGVVGAHAGGFNSGTVGIALLGNYQDNNLPAPMLESLQALVQSQAELHGIDITAKGNYRGLYLDNLLMHGELNATSCPGENTGDYVRPMRSGKAISSTASSNSTSNSSSAQAQVVGGNTDWTFDSGQTRTVWIQLKNKSTQTWNAADLSLTLSGASGATLGPIHSSMKNIPPGATPRLFFTLTAPTQSGTYKADLQANWRGQKLLAQAHPLNLNVAVELPSVTLSQYEQPIRIKLTTELGTGPSVTSTSDFSLYNASTFLHTFSKGAQVKVRSTGTQYLVTSGLKRWTVEGPLRFIPETSGVMQVLNMEQRPAWNPKLNDNLFRGTLEVQHENGQLIVINELPLEDYLKGVAEVSNDTHPEKAKAMSILARTYALYYLTQDRKFPGKAYDLDDDPDASQKYLGYGFEIRSNLIKTAVESTEDMVVTYQGKVVKTPYFSQSDGVRTKSAQEVWGWTDTPYLQSVSDTHCASSTPWGHQVGLSGCGAEALAKQGKSYIDIIQYYFTGVQVERYNP